MAETFQDLKVKLIEHYRRVQSADELTAGFNLLVDGEELRQLIGGLKKTFPKEPALGDEYTMYFAYAMMQADQRTTEDLLDWRRHTKKFINNCPQNHNLANHLRSVIHHLPEMGGTTGETYNYGLRALNLLPKTYPQYRECVKAVEKMARSDFRFLLDKAKNEPDYQKQLKAYDRALARLTDIPSGERYKGLDECMQAMFPVYNRTEWGRLELPHKRRLASKRIFKSLPHEAQTAIRNRKHYNDWLSR